MNPMSQFIFTSFNGLLMIPLDILFSILYIHKYARQIADHKTMSFGYSGLISSYGCVHGLPTGLFLFAFTVYDCSGFSDLQVCIESNHIQCLVSAPDVGIMNQ